MEVGALCFEYQLFYIIPKKPILQSNNFFLKKNYFALPTHNVFVMDVSYILCFMIIINLKSIIFSMLYDSCRCINKCIHYRKCMYIFIQVTLYNIFPQRCTLPKQDLDLVVT